MPQFAPSSVHQATITFSNPKSAGFDYTASLCMGTAMIEMASASFHLDAGQSKAVMVSVTMPAASGTYPVYIAVFSGGKTIALYKATEDVVIAALPITIPDPSIALLSLAWTSGAIASDFLVNSGQTATIRWYFVDGTWTIYNQYTLVYRIEANLVLAGVVKASGSIYPPVSSGGSLPTDIQMPSTPGVYDLIIKVYRNSVLTGTYPMGQLTVYALAEPSNLSYENLSFSITAHPGATSWGMLNVACDIRNIGSTPITRGVALWYHSSYPGGWRVITMTDLVGNGILGTYAPRVILTLTPGQVFHYVYVGDYLGHGSNCIELRDNMGGKSAYSCQGW